MRSLFVAVAVCAATAAQADTLLRYTGPAFNNVSCNRPCHFTNISFSVRLPGAAPQGGSVQFCAGSQCASSAKVSFANGETRLNTSNAGQFQFTGSVQFDQAGAQVAAAQVDGGQFIAGHGTTLYMSFGSLNGGDTLGGDFHNFNVDASATAVGVWTVKSISN